jgi:hypothetical protein
MEMQKQNDPKKDVKPANTPQQIDKNPTHARTGGQTDSATGGKPGGGGQPQSPKK